MIWYSPFHRRSSLRLCKISAKSVAVAAKTAAVAALLTKQISTKTACPWQTKNVAVAAILKITAVAAISKITAVAVVSSAFFSVFLYDLLRWGPPPQTCHHHM
jgi:hypothetical protein